MTKNIRCIALLSALACAVALSATASATTKTVSATEHAPPLMVQKTINFEQTSATKITTDRITLTTTKLPGAIAVSKATMTDRECNTIGTHEHLAPFANSASAIEHNNTTALTDITSAGDDVHYLNPTMTASNYAPPAGLPLPMSRQPSEPAFARRL